MVNKSTLNANDVPKVFGRGDTWHVQDKYGNMYHMSKMPNDIFFKKNGKDMEVHLVYSTSKQSKLNPDGSRKREDPF